MTEMIERRLWDWEPVTVDATGWDGEGGEEALKTWLESQAESYHLDTLLAHADDGVIWGRMGEDKKLYLSSGRFPKYGGNPPLRSQTLQEGRLFGPEAELYFWREGEGQFKARLIRDGQGIEGETQENYQILWGTERTAQDDKFVLVSDGGLENRHAPPLLEDVVFAPGVNFRPLRLLLRHYISVDEETGMATIGHSRLVALESVKPVKQNGKGG